jgi:uncharacterized repeat protein (TIGR03803 family)
LTPPPTKKGKWQEKVLYRFTGLDGGGIDGANPAGPLWFDAATHTLYGSTLYGGAGTCPDAEGAVGCGTVFSLTAPTAPAVAWKPKLLYRFTGEKGDGANPSGALTPSGSLLYGTTRNGGTGGLGTVFELPLAGGKAEPIYSFGSVAGDGANPYAGVVAATISSQFMLFGATANGGTTGGACGSTGCGTVFALAQVSGAWMESVQAFNFGNGATPYAGLTINGGVLYGVTYAGGSSACLSNDPEGVAGCGTIFEVQATAGGLGDLQTLYVFSGGADGANPYAGVIFANVLTAGVLYGTTAFGGDTTGACGAAGCGLLYRLALTGNLIEPLYTFQGGADESNPYGGVIFDIDGNLYGATAPLGAAVLQGATAPLDRPSDSGDNGTAFSFQCTKVPQCCGKGC